MKYRSVGRTKLAVLAQVNEMRIFLNTKVALAGRGKIAGWDVFPGMTNYYVTLWKEEWLENLREAGEGYRC